MENGTVEVNEIAASVLLGRLKHTAVFDDRRFDRFDASLSSDKGGEQHGKAFNDLGVGFSAGSERKLGHRFGDSFKGFGEFSQSTSLIFLGRVISTLSAKEWPKPNGFMVV
jgi:hypothetical protein